MYMLPHSAPAASAATMPRMAVALPVAADEAMARSVAPQNITAAPPTTDSQRTLPEPRSSQNNSQPQKIPSRLFRFQRGKRDAQADIANGENGERIGDSPQATGQHAPHE